MFVKANLLQRLKYKYEDEPLRSGSKKFSGLILNWVQTVYARCFCWFCVTPRRIALAPI